MTSSLEDSKTAAGGAAWDDVRTLYLKVRIQTGGLEGTGESWHDVAHGRYAERFTMGPMQGASGFDGTIAWTQDVSGEVRERLPASLVVFDLLELDATVNGDMGIVCTVQSTNIVLKNGRALGHGHQPEVAITPGQGVVAPEGVLCPAAARVVHDAALRAP